MHFLLLPVVAILAAIAGAETQQPAPAPYAFTRAVHAGAHAFTADFARIEVPVVRTAESSATLQIAVCRLRSTATRPGAPLFYLPGQPAAATGLRDSAAWADFWAGALAQGDVVLMDERGAGELKPRLEWQPDDWQPWLLYGDEKTAYAHALEFAARARASSAERGVPLHAFTPVACADDVDDVRRALGYETIQLMGHSSGSLLAQVVLRRHGAHVARWVGVGVAGPDDVMKPPSKSEASLRAVAALARADSRIGEAMPDLEASLRAALAALDEKPLAVRIAHPRSGAPLDVSLGRFGMQLLVLQDLGDERDLAVLPRLLRTVAARDPSLVRWFLQKRVDQLASMPLALLASRAAVGASPETWEQIAREAGSSPFGRARCLFCPEIAAALGVEPLGADFRRSFTSRVPALFVSGTLDANTPPEQAERVRAGFARSAHIVVEHAGHDTILHDTQARERILAFLAGEPVEDERIPRPPLQFVPLDGHDVEPTHPAVEAARKE